MLAFESLIFILHIRCGVPSFAPLGPGINKWRCHCWCRVHWLYRTEAALAPRCPDSDSGVTWIWTGSAQSFPPVGDNYYCSGIYFGTQAGLQSPWSRFQHRTVQSILASAYVGLLFPSLIWFPDRLLMTAWLWKF